MPRKPLKNPKRNQIRVTLPKSKMLIVRVIAILKDRTLSAWLSELIHRGLAQDKGFREDRKMRNMDRLEETEFTNTYVTDETNAAVKDLCKKINYSKQALMEEWIDAEIESQRRANPDLFDNEERLVSIVQAHYEDIGDLK